LVEQWTEKRENIFILGRAVDWKARKYIYTW